jgi:DNA-binding winged helix-turn-helix (wHTH) protein
MAVKPRGETPIMSVDPKEPSYPSLQVREPNGPEYTISFKDLLEKKPAPDRLMLGRNPDNDIVLEDPHKMISRYHCVFEQANGHWWVQDHGSANGTFVKSPHGSTEIDVRLEESVPLRNGDEILVLGQVSDADEPIFWRLTFGDPTETFRVRKLQVSVNVEYSLSQQRLFFVMPHDREEVKLSPLERKLLQYMAQRNLDNDSQPVVCDHHELIEALWETPFSKTNNDVTRITWSIRNKIEQDRGEPRFLKTVKHSGYLLEVKLIN